MKYYIGLALILCIVCPTNAQFKQLPKTLDWTRLGDENLSGMSVTAEYGNDYILFVTGDQLSFYPKTSGTAEIAPIRFNELKGMPANWNKITGAVSWDDGKILLFNGKSGITIDANKQVQELGDWENLPFANGAVTAACNVNSNTLWLINGTDYVSYTKLSQVTSPAKSLTSIKGWPAEWNNLTAAVNGGDGRIYFFNKNQVLPYDIASQSFLEGFPKVIRETGTSEAASPFKKPANSITEQKNQENTATNTADNNNKTEPAKPDNPAPAPPPPPAASGWPEGVEQKGIIVYTGRNFTGESKQFTRPVYFYDLINKNKGWNKSIRSIRVAPGYVARVYRQEYYQGPRLDLYEDWSSEHDPEWDRQAMCIGVYKR